MTGGSPFLQFLTDLLPGLIGDCVYNAYLWDRQASRSPGRAD